jgi:hypothetical protein
VVGLSVGRMRVRPWRSGPVARLPVGAGPLLGGPATVARLGRPVVGLVVARLGRPVVGLVDVVAVPLIGVGCTAAVGIAELSLELLDELLRVWRHGSVGSLPDETGFIHIDHDKMGQHVTNVDKPEACGRARVP